MTTGDRALAGEGAAETFLVAWRGRESVADDDRPLLPWLLGIAARQSLNATRGVRRRLAFLSRRPGPAVVDDFAEKIAARLGDARLLGRTRGALALPTKAEAEVVGLCVWSGLTYAEAADAIDVPVGTVRPRLSRARSRLRALTADNSLGRPRDDHDRAHAQSCAQPRAQSRA